MPRRFRSPTCFPYTTLFRSFRRTRQAEQGRGLGVETTDLLVDLVRLRPGGPSFTRRDRKCTRLHSSHTVISYAVFCVEKNRKKDAQRELLYKKSEWSI